MASHRSMLTGAAVGAALGFVAHAIGSERPVVKIAIDYVAQPLGQLFLRSLFMLVIPLLFSALVLGVSELELKHLGRIGLRTLAYTAVVSLISVVIGLVLVNVVQPGSGLPSEVRARAAHSTGLTVAAAPSGNAVSVIVNMLPDNPVKAAASGDMLALIVFSLIFGIALASVDTLGTQRLREMIQGLFDVSMKIIDAVLRVAPIGVAALMFGMVARTGTSLFAQLGAYVGVVLLGLALHMFGVYSIGLRLLSGKSPLAFFREVRPAMVTAFSTASSNATLPTALQVAEENLRLPSHVSRFVLTAGSAMNQNGTALFEGVTVLFLAQLYGVSLDLGKQLTVMVIAVLGGIGTAGVPAGSLPVIAMILGMLGVPVEGIGLIFGIDRLLDMCRTTVNVIGDLAAAVYVASAEPQGDAAVEQLSAGEA
jgi:DAACS family dicarboxylate/amino acid:cation (Na+ or H+) symporter